MLTRTMKYVAIATLILAAVLWNYAPPYERVLGFVIALGAVLAAIEAARAGKHKWAAGFYGVALIFNPVLPMGAFVGSVAFSVVTASVGLFACSLYMLKTQPVMSVPSITGRNPGSQSL